MANIKSTLVAIRGRAIGNLLEKTNRAIAQLQANQDKHFAQLQELQNVARKYDSIGIMQLSEKEIATKIFNDLIMYLDPRDLAVVPHLVLERIWEREITYAWLSVLNNPNSVVIDIGANFGYYGMLAAQRLDKEKGKVVFFEPNPELHYYIHKTLSVNWLNENSVVENMGLAEASGTAQLHILEDYVGSSSMHSVEQLSSYLSEQMHLKAQSVITVPTVTLDEYCKTHDIKKVNYVKMDIEGYEEAAYLGMKQIVKSSPEMILFLEFTKGGYKDPRGFYGKLRTDFAHVYEIEKDGTLLSPRDPSYEALIAPTKVLIFLVFSKKPIQHGK